MRARFMGEAAVLLFLSGSLYSLAVELQHYLFHSTEFLPGINWIYLPAGLRVLLVMVAVIWGALGICLASVLIEWRQYGDYQHGMVLATSLVSGFGAWLALQAMQGVRRMDRQLQGLDIGQLLEYILLYAFLNCLGHHLVWWAYGRDTFDFMIDFWPMLVGDLAGATTVLLVFKLSLRFLRHLLPQRIGDDQT